MQVTVSEPKEVEVSKIKLCIKVCDGFNCDILNSSDEKVGEYEGYVPMFFPGQHWGDYLMLDIDLESGKILNWSKPTEEDISNMLAPDDEQNRVQLITEGA